MTTVALITGITGQDGSYLAEFLLEKKYIVWGIIRKSSSINTHRIDHLYSNKALILRYGDLSDSANILHILYEIKTTYPEMSRLEIYNLGAMSHVKVSFEMPEYTGNIDGLGVLRLLEAIRSTGLQEKTRYYQASTSELYGKVQETPQTEKTPFYPRSPYGVAKLYGFWIVKNYRESYGMYATNGILFNHESPRRGETFVTRKITRGIGMILRGERDRLVMGNLDSFRDWGHSRDYVKGMWMILQSETPDDYVLATQHRVTIREFVNMSFKEAGFDELIWLGEGGNEKGYLKRITSPVVEVSPKYFRPYDLTDLIGNAKKVKEEIGWKEEYTLKEIIKDMLTH